MKSEVMAFVVVLIALTGCTTTKVVTQGGPRIGREFIFKTSEVAPADFDAFTFFWTSPSVERFDTQVSWIIALPNGKECMWDNDVVMSAGQSVRSDVAAYQNPPMGDPRQFRNKHIAVIFRANNGRMRFPSGDECSFAFYKNGPDGKINWSDPYKQIRAITEQK